MNSTLGKTVTKDAKKLHFNNGLVIDYKYITHITQRQTDSHKDRHIHAERQTDTDTHTHTPTHFKTTNDMQTLSLI